MKKSLNIFCIWLIATFITICVRVPLAYPFDNQKKSVKEAPRNSQAFVSESVPRINYSKKKESPPFSDHSIRREKFFSPIIQRVSLRYNIDPALVRAIIMAESQYNPKAVSVKGAMGLMQLMPVTAKYLGVDDLFNPEQNIDAGVRHFKWMLKQFDGDVTLALAAYNAGSKVVKRYKDIPPFKETKRYLKKVMRYYERYKDAGIEASAERSRLRQPVIDGQASAVVRKLWRDKSPRQVVHIAKRSTKFKRNNSRHRDGGQARHPAKKTDGY